MFEELVAGNPGDTFFNFYNTFISWFSGLETAGQVVTGILIVLGLVGIGYLVYGSLWIGYQALKISILVSIVVTYLLLELWMILLIAIFNAERLEDHVKGIGKNIKYIAKAFYPNNEKSNKVQNSQANQPTRVVVVNQEYSQAPQGYYQVQI